MPKIAKLKFNEWTIRWPRAELQGEISTEGVWGFDELMTIAGMPKLGDKADGIWSDVLLACNILITSDKPDQYVFTVTYSPRAETVKTNQPRIT